MMSLSFYYGEGEVMAKEKNKKKINDDVIVARVTRWSLLVLTALLSFFCWSLWFSQKNESYRQAYAMRMRTAYKTFHNRITDYVRLDSLGATAIQADGDFQRTSHFAMSEEYRYRELGWDTDQNSQEYYKVTFYNFNTSVEEGVTFDLYQVIPNLKETDDKSSFEVFLFEVESTAYLKVAYDDGTVQNHILKLTDEKSLEEVPVDSVMIPDKNVKVDKEAIAPLGQYLSDARKLGEELIGLDESTFSIRIKGTGDEQRVIYQEEPDFLSYQKKGLMVSILILIKLLQLKKQRSF